METNIHKLLKFKKLIKMKTITTLIIALFTIFSICAQSPLAFNYQGVARNLSGNPIPNQDIGLQIAILQGSVSGSEVYKETHLVTTNQLGLFNIQIGNGIVVNGNLIDIDWGTEDHFLQLELDESGGNNYQLVGTSQLLSVPYALYASNGSQWKDIDDGIHYEEKVNIGVLTPDFLNYDLNIRRDDPQNVGIQIINSNPTGRSLVLTGEGNLGRYIYMGYLSSSHEPINSAVKPASGVIYTGGNNGLNFVSENGAISFTSGGLNETDQRLVIKPNGNIGLGTSSPDAKLQVTNGDIYIENVNKGVIMKSPNGQCWRYTPDNNGQLVSTAITCPN